MFTWFDIIILTIITTSSMLGLYGGIVKLTTNLIGFIASIIISYYLYQYSVEIIGEYITNQVGMRITSGVVSYIISLIICSLLTRKFLSMISVITKGSIDRLFGLIAGLARGIIICLVIFFTLAICFSGSYLQAKNLQDVLQNISFNKYPIWLKDSVTTVYLDDLSNKFIKILPKASLESIKLPRESDITDMTNVLKKPHLYKQSPDKTEKLPEDLRRELDEMLSKKNEHKD